MTKKICSLILALVMMLSCFCFTATAEESIVKDGLAAWYDGVKNTENGHNADSLVWEDLAGDNDVTVIKDAKNYFTDDAYHLNSTKHNFPSALLDLINGKEFTVELRLGEVKKIGGSFATFINSSGNDNFALFVRHAGDYVEFKAASNSRPKVTGGLEYVTDSTLTITFKSGGKCSMYVDGILIGSVNASSTVGAAGNLFFGHSESGKTHEADYRGMRFYTRALSADEVVQNAKADGTYDPSNEKEPFKTLAQPETNIIGDITLSTIVKDKATLDSFKKDGFKPACAIFELADGLKVKGESGEFAEVKEVFEALGGVIVPIFYIKSEQSANELITYLKENKIIDVTVMSDDPALIKYARKEYTYLRGVIDYSVKLAGKTLTQAQLLDIRAECTSNLAKTAVLPMSATKQNVSYLNSRQITTWIMADSGASEKDELSMLLSETYGIISEKPESVYNTAEKYVTENALIRSPGMIGHRGIPSTHPENTLGGAKAAYEAGADIIEIDIYLTVDNVIVINHDAQTTLYNKKVAVESCSLKILKELVYKGYEDSEDKELYRIPTLEEFLKEFKDKDVMLFIEIKSQKPQIVTKMKELIDEYDMYGQCAVIAYEQTGQLPRMMEKYPEMPVGGLSSLTNSGLDATLPAIFEFVGKYNTTFNPSYSGYDAEYIRESLARGITTWPYTINDAAIILQFIGHGHAGITTNYVNVTGKLVKELTVAAKNGEFINPYVGASYELDALSSLYNRTSQSESSAEFIIVDGDAAKLENGKLTFTKEGSVSIIAKVKKTINGYVYTAYSDVMTYEVTVPAPITQEPITQAPESEAPSESGIPTEENTDGKNAIVFVIIGVAALGVIGGAVVVIIKKKKA